MATLSQIMVESAARRREREGPRVVEIGRERCFLGTSWDFIIYSDDSATWWNRKTGTVLPSSGNTGKEKP